jgi:hypothetical protein
MNPVREIAYQSAIPCSMLVPCCALPTIRLYDPLLLSSNVVE